MAAGSGGSNSCGGSMKTLCALLCVAIAFGGGPALSAGQAKIKTTVTKTTVTKTNVTKTNLAIRPDFKEPVVL